MKNYSGVVLENNANILRSLTASSNFYCQRFKLPALYPRGTDNYLPDLTGFQIFLETNLSQINVEWSLQVTTNRKNEVQQIHLNGLSSGTYQLSFLGSVTNAIAYNATAATIQTELESLSTILPGNVEVGTDLSVTFKGQLAKTNVPMLEVTGNTVTVTEAVPAYQWNELASGDETLPILTKNNKGWLDIEFDVPVESSFLTEDWRFNFSVNAQVCCSAYNEQRGRLETVSESIIPVDGNPVSSIYRVMGATLDDAIDFLSNDYRGSIKEHLAKDIIVNDENVWMSKPNPSKFAVEALYFDVRSGNQPAVINRILLDPVTPGIACNIYYSVDPTGPGTDETSWDMLLWTPIPIDLKLFNRQIFELPFPVTASYIKLEFTQLQARNYIVNNDYQQKVTYKKHPKWVLDYFFGVYLDRKAQEIVSEDITLEYNALSLYYNYFVDDLVSSPFFPQLVDRSVSTDIFKDYLTTLTNEELTGLDVATLNQIQINSNTYNRHPIVAATYRESVIRKYMFPRDLSNYSTELVRTAVADTELVSAMDRDAVQLDKEFPVMSFYMKSRHQYKKSKAKFETDKAYFAGIKQVSFHRDYYASAVDQEVYSETAGDETNIDLNDLQFENGYWTGKGTG